ncbi:MAG: hypothetical protein KBS74_03530 [Clostridiales bacterium]|nr:hypothetical protein [Candidatus Cacconaster stercorequi]
MDQEPIYPESLRKYTPIIAALGIVLLVVFFFLPKSAASVMHVDEAKVTAVRVSVDDGTAHDLSAQQMSALLDALRSTRIKLSSKGGAVAPSSYTVNIVSGEKELSFSISPEGVLYYDSAAYRIRGESELIPLLQEAAQ